MIPKIIHQMWLDISVDNNDGPPGLYVRLGHPRKFQELNPEYLYMFWNNARVLELFREEPYKKYYDFYTNIISMHIERCDFARLAILHKYGGFYFDLDVEPHRAIPDEHRKYDLFFIREPVEHRSVPPVDNNFCNAIMGSVKGHKFWLDFMDHIVRNYMPGGTPMVLVNTGPVALTRWINTHYPQIVNEMTLDFSCQYFSKTKNGAISATCRGTTNPVATVNMEQGSHWGFDFNYERNGDVIIEREPALNYIIGMSSIGVISGFLLIAVIILAVKLKECRDNRDSS